MNETLATSIDDRVDEVLGERFRSMMRAALIGAPISLPVLVAILWTRVERPWLLLAWSIAALTCAAVQWATYLRAGHEGDWLTPAVITQSLAGTIWGLLPAAAAIDDQLWQMAVGQVVIGVLAGASIFASTLRVLYYPFVVPVTLLGAITYGVWSSGSARLLTLLIIAFAGFYAWLARHVRRNEERTARLTIELEVAAHTDRLTGLANRAHFTERLEAMIAESRPAVVFVDLDKFKPINDAHGHQVGDEVLAIVAKRLSRVLRPNDMAARLGGDEFTVLVERADSTTLESLADRIVHAIGRPITVQGVTVQVGASVGGAIATPGQTAAQLLNSADQAQYEAKRGGGGAVRITQLRSVS